MPWYRDPRIVLTALCGAFTLVGFFNLHPAIPYFAVLFGAYFAIVAAAESIRERSIDVNLLMVLAAIGAIMIGEPLDAAILLFLFSLSGTLESLAMARTRNAIEGLIKLRPDTAIRITGNGDEVVRVEALKIGDRIKIPPFEPIPVDGTIFGSPATVDQSAMTGESVPVHLKEGDRAIGGTRNQDQTLTMEVASEVGDSTLDKIVGLVRDAQENKASGERISSWFGQRYTILVILAFVISLTVRLALKIPYHPALYESIALLVALSPCALVISTPATTLSALAWAARNGMLVRGGEFIEIAGKVDAIAVDKTGTLTHGKPQLVEICVCSRELSTVGAPGECTDREACWHEGDNLTDETRELLRAAAAVERHATHPVADAVRSAATEFGIDPPIAADERTVPGLGIVATVDGKKVVVGQSKLFDAEGIAISPAFHDHVDSFQRSGMTVALLSVGDQVAALGFRDAPRAESKSFLEEVRAEGVAEVAMLSGDTPRTAESVATEIGLPLYRGGLMPEDKAEFIGEWVESGRTVMMVGDGINDAPPLARASVGVAMGGLGSDIALNSADVVLMYDRLDRIPELMRLGKMTNRIIRTNLIFATGVIATLTVFSLLGRLPLPLAVVGHEGSTVLVILNGLRVLGGPPPSSIRKSA